MSRVHKHSDIAHNIHTFFFQPYKLVGKSVPSKIGITILSILAGIPTLGIFHLVAYTMKNKFFISSKKDEKTWSIVEKTINLQLPGSVKNLNSSEPKKFASVNAEEVGEKSLQISIEEKNKKKVLPPTEQNITVLSSESDLKSLSSVDKQQRMDGFVELFSEKKLFEKDLFNVSGNPEKIEKLSKSFASDTFSWFEETDDINDIVVLFKNFIKSCDLFADQEVQEIILKIEKEANENKQIKLWNKLIKKVPEANQKLLKDLLFILNEVSKKCEKDVNPRIFAVRFGPILFPKLNSSFFDTNLSIFATGSLIDLYVKGSSLFKI